MPSTIEYLKRSTVDDVFLSSKGNDICMPALVQHINNNSSIDIKLPDSLCGKAQACNSRKIIVHQRKRSFFQEDFFIFQEGGKTDNCARIISNYIHIEGEPDLLIDIYKTNQDIPLVKDLLAYLNKHKKEGCSFEHVHLYIKQFLESKDRENGCFFIDLHDISAKKGTQKLCRLGSSLSTRGTAGFGDDRYKKLGDRGFTFHKKCYDRKDISWWEGRSKKYRWGVGGILPLVALGLLALAIGTLPGLPLASLLLSVVAYTGFAAEIIKLSVFATAGILMVPPVVSLLLDKYCKPRIDLNLPLEELMIFDKQASPTAVDDSNDRRPLLSSADFSPPGSRRGAPSVPTSTDETPRGTFHASRSSSTSSSGSSGIGDESRMSTSTGSSPLINKPDRTNTSRFSSKRRLFSKLCSSPTSDDEQCNIYQELSTRL